MTSEHAAFLRHYEAFKDRIYTYFWYRTGFQREVAEDCAQEVFLKAFRAFSSFDQRRAFSPWIFRIAHNHLVNYYRAARPSVPLDEVIESIEVSVTMGAAIASQIEWERVLRGIHQLSEHDRDLLLLRYVDQMSHEEIAEVVGKRPGAVRVAVHRATQKLRGMLEIPERTAMETAPDTTTV